LVFILQFAQRFVLLAKSGCKPGTQSRSSIDRNVGWCYQTDFRHFIGWFCWDQSSAHNTGKGKMASNREDRE